MEIKVEKKNPMIGKRVDFKISNRDSLEKNEQGINTGRNVYRWGQWIFIPGATRGY